MFQQTYKQALVHSYDAPKLQDQITKNEPIVLVMSCMFSLFYIKKKIEDLFNFYTSIYICCINMYVQAYENVGPIKCN